MHVPAIHMSFVPTLHFVPSLATLPNFEKTSSSFKQYNWQISSV